MRRFVTTLVVLPGATCLQVVGAQGSTGTLPAGAGGRRGPADTGDLPGEPRRPGRPGRPAADARAQRGRGGTGAGRGAGPAHRRDARRGDGYAPLSAPPPAGRAAVLIPWLPWPFSSSTAAPARCRSGSRTRTGTVSRRLPTPATASCPRPGTP